MLTTSSIYIDDDRRTASRSPSPTQSRLHRNGTSMPRPNDKDIDMADSTNGVAGGGGDNEDEDVVEAQMKAMLGIGGFGTTKQKKVKGNDVYAVGRDKKATYRQYMNRVGGFNRALSPS